MQAIKYQDRIHAAFADEVILKDALEEFKRMQEQFPNLKLKPDAIDNKEADALKGGNVSICRHFVMETEEGKALDFDSPHVKDVAQTVRANVNYYNNLTQFLKDEKEEGYAKIYSALQKKLDEYFSLAAEDILTDVYGETYTAFRDKFTKEEEARQTARVNARKENAEKKAAEE